jgi:hypothetical protein
MGLARTVKALEAFRVKTLVAKPTVEIFRAKELETGFLTRQERTSSSTGRRNTLIEHFCWVPQAGIFRSRWFSEEQSGSGLLGSKRRGRC